MALALALLLLPVVGLADGTETLGAPEVSIAAGTGVVAAGVGLESGQPADISIDVPAGATVVQVLLYWSHETVIGGDDTLNVGPGAIEVTGVQIGGPAFFFNFSGKPVDVYGFRADITSLGLVSAGSNTVAVGGLDTQVSTPGTGAHGAGLLVIYDDGGGLSDIGVVDGVDLAWCGFPEPRKSTIPQTIGFTPHDEDRAGRLVLFTGSVSQQDPIRPTEIRIAFDGGVPTSLFNELNAADGNLWESKTLDLTIPAGTSSATVSVQSANPDGTCPSNPQNASLSWIAATLAVPTPEDGDGEGCTPGFWRQPHHLDSWVGYSPGDSFDAVFGVDAQGDQTLLEAVWQGGGGARALGRHAVAALLNSVDPDVQYEFSEAEVIQIVQDAYASGDFNGAKNLLEGQNEQYCPLD